MRLFLLAAGGGAIGAGARYLINVTCTACLGVAFPWATLFVNVVGSFLMGVVVAAGLPWFGGSAAWRTFLATGILGGFTTFSAFSLDAWDLFERQQGVLAVSYIAGSVVLSILGLVAGLAVTRAVLT
jgi:fluoride exporter